MSRPPLEVADLIRSAGAAFIERNRQWIRWKHVKDSAVIPSRLKDSACSHQLWAWQRFRTFQFFLSRQPWEPQGRTSRHPPPHLPPAPTTTWLHQSTFRFH